MKKPLSVALLLFALLFVGQAAWSADAKPTPSPAPPAKGAEPAGLPLQQLRIFAEVYERIKQDYVEPVSDKTLLEHAIEGMLSGLDPHSAYLTADKFAELRADTTGQFVGLGIEVGMQDGFLKVISPIDDTPAQRAGIRSGDLIVRINNHSVKGLTLDDAVRLMRGKPGTRVTLLIVRKGREAPFKVTLKRAVIKTRSVKARMLAPGFAYVRLSQFQARTPQDMLKAIARLKQQAGGQLKGLVLDLRNNPGGVLNAAVAVSDAFLTKGVIVYTKGRVADSQLKFRASPGDVLEGAPIVVLVNGGTASASEIVSGALQDHRRAVIMGQQTFGKGSVQTVIPINATTAIKLTTARYFTPNGRSIQAEGITPDIILHNVTVSENSHPQAFVSEANLAGHLANPDGPVPVEKSDKNKTEKPLAERDYALSEALHLLKGLTILRAGAGSGAQ